MENTLVCWLVIGTRSWRAVSQVREPGAKVSRCDGEEGIIVKGVIGRIGAVILVLHETAERREVGLVFFCIARRHVHWMLVGFLWGEAGWFCNPHDRQYKNSRVSRVALVAMRFGESNSLYNGIF